MSASKYDGAPRYMPSALVRAQVFDEAGTVNHPDGPIPVAAGEALVVPPDGTEPYVTGAAAFGAEHLPIPGLPIVHVTRSRRTYRAVQIKGRMHVEGDFESHDAATWLASHARTSDDGRTVLAHGALPLDLQRTLLAERGEAGMAHAKALAAVRDHLANFAFGDLAAQQQVNAYDLAGARVRDVVSDGMAEIHSVATPMGIVIDEEARTARLREGSVLETLVSSTGIHPGAFTEARHMPTYAVEAYRGLTRRILSPFLGDHPLETVLVSAVAGAAHPVEDWARGGELVAEEPSPPLPEMPGYITTDMRHYRRDDVDVLCYEDAQGAYAFCWASPATPAPKP